MNAARRAIRTVLTSFVVYVVAACRSDAPVTSARGQAAPESAPGQASLGSPAQPAEAAKSEALVFREQPGWQRKSPASSMRKAEFILPRVAADAEDATLAVYYFGPGQGGGREANLERWASQFDQPDGVSSKERIESSSRKVAGLDVHDVQLAGTYVAETSPGSGTRVRKEGWRLLASIVESDHGPYYAKLVGPAATVTHWEASYRRFISEVRPGG